MGQEIAGWPEILYNLPANKYTKNILNSKQSELDNLLFIIYYLLFITIQRDKKKNGYN